MLPGGAGNIAMAVGVEEGSGTGVTSAECRMMGRLGRLISDGWEMTCEMGWRYPNFELTVLSPRRYLVI